MDCEEVERLMSGVDPVTSLAAVIEQRQCMHCKTVPNDSATEHDTGYAFFHTTNMQHSLAQG